MEMTDNELARELFGRRSREDGGMSASNVTVINGTATEDSEGGTVRVDIGGEVLGSGIAVDDATGAVTETAPEQGVEVPTTGGIKAGDAVTVIVDNGTPTSAVGTGSVDAVADTAERAETLAGEARAVAEAVGQHFWWDDGGDGAHVTEVPRSEYEQQPSGFQQLLTSVGSLLTKAVNGVERLLRADTASGTVFYDGEVAADDPSLAAHAVASFSKDGAQIGSTSGRHMTIDSDSQELYSATNDDATVFAEYEVSDEGIKYMTNPRANTDPVFDVAIDDEYIQTVYPMDGMYYAVTHSISTYGADGTVNFSDMSQDVAEVLRVQIRNSTIGTLWRDVEYSVDFDNYTIAYTPANLNDSSARVFYRPKTQNARLMLKSKQLSSKHALQVNAGGQTTFEVDYNGSMRQYSQGVSPYSNVYTPLMFDGGNVMMCNGQEYAHDSSGKLLDNLSYVSSTDSIRTPVLVTGYAGGTGVNVHSNSKVRRSGRQVNAHLIFNVASNSGTASGAIFVTGLPRPYETSWCIAALANGSKACRMYVDGSGNLRLDTTRPDVGWWTCAVSYFTQD